MIPRLQRALILYKAASEAAKTANTLTGLGEHISPYESRTKTLQDLRDHAPLPSVLPYEASTKTMQGLGQHVKPSTKTLQGLSNYPNPSSSVQGWVPKANPLQDLSAHIPTRPVEGWPHESRAKTLQNLSEYIPTSAPVAHIPTSAPLAHINSHAHALPLESQARTLQGLSSYVPADGLKSRLNYGNLGIGAGLGGALGAGAGALIGGEDHRGTGALIGGGVGTGVGAGIGGLLGSSRANDYLRSLLKRH